MEKPFEPLRILVVPLETGAEDTAKTEKAPAVVALTFQREGSSSPRKGLRFRKQHGPSRQTAGQGLEADTNSGCMCVRFRESHSQDGRDNALGRRNTRAMAMRTVGVARLRN